MPYIKMFGSLSGVRITP